MTNSSDMDYYKIALDLVREGIRDWLLDETVWYWEDDEFLGTYEELDTLRCVITDIKNHLG